MNHVMLQETKSITHNDKRRHSCMIHHVILLIIASEGYQPIEYGSTRHVLEKSGCKVLVASNASGIAHASSSTPKKYAKVHVDLVLNDIDVDDFDGIFIVGGPGALDMLNNKITYQIMQQAAQKSKLIGAICISPRILAHAGLLHGKKATGWDEDHELAAVLKKAGATYVKNPVVVDGNIITATGPQAAEAFGAAIVNSLKQRTP